jgi:hypothetical protein
MFITGPLNRTLSPVRVAILAIAFSGLAACQTPRNPAARTRSEQLMLADVLYDYQARNGRLPEQLSEVCSLACVPGSDEMNDAWGRPFEYRTAGASYEIRSVGADGVRLTGDDVVYSPAAERAQALRVAGCYRTDLAELNQGAPRLLVLDTVPVAPGALGYRVQPVLYDRSYWVPDGGDSIEVSLGGRTGFGLEMEFARDSLRGYRFERTEHDFRRLGRVAATRVDCDLDRIAGR